MKNKKPIPLQWALQWLAGTKKQYIDGQWVEGLGEAYTSINPADCDELCHMYLGTAEQVEEAAVAANRAHQSGVWSKTSRTVRTEILRKIARLIRDHVEELAVLETLANGKLYTESLVDDIPTCADIFDYYAGWTDKIYGETCPVDDGFLNYTLREPVGVCGLIAPWNFPLYQTALKLAPALAMGNTCLIKPSLSTPFTAMYLVELIDKHLDLPKGVINLLISKGSTCNAMTMSNNVHKVSFTGSTGIGRTITNNAVNSNFKTVTLELGGKSPCIFFEDTPNLAGAIDRAFTVMFSHKGEKCSEPTRFIIHKNIYDHVLEELIKRAEAVRCGNPFDERVTQGAQCNKGQFDTIMNYIEIGKSEAEMVTGGYRDENGDNRNGYFIRPTIFTNVDKNARIFQEEIFGPVLCCTPFETDEEAVALANATTFGLGSGLYTSDISRAHRIAEQINAGMVFVNRYGCYGLSSPFGGFNSSGWGKEMGIHSLASYTRTKSVWVSFG